MLDQQRWVDLFVAAGLPAIHEPHMLRWLRSHVPMCIAFESVSVLGVRRGGGASWREARMLARGVHAGFALIEGLGYEVYPASKRRPAVVIASMLWFMSRIRSFRELLATGEPECRALVDAMLARSSTPVPAIAAMKP